MRISDHYPTGMDSLFWKYVLLVVNNTTSKIQILSPYHHLTPSQRGFYFRISLTKPYLPILTFVYVPQRANLPGLLLLCTIMAGKTFFRKFNWCLSTLSLSFTEKRGSGGKQLPPNWSYVADDNFLGFYNITTLHLSICGIFSTYHVQVVRRVSDRTNPNTQPLMPGKKHICTNREHRKETTCKHMI